mmetsp:Transcript_21765/g.33612  ORF Transcript_21765/g.33612 Transcript_21765/m.33612 type:complete len:160 (+) Transcript_21765:981-1460(+)
MTPLKTVQVDSVENQTPRGFFSFFFQNKVSNHSDHRPSGQTEPSKIVNQESPDLQIPDDKMNSPIEYGHNSSKVNSRQFFADDSQFGSIAVEQISKTLKGAVNDTIDPSLCSPHTARKAEGQTPGVSFAYNAPVQLNGTEGNLETFNSRANLQPVGESL